MRLFRIRNYDEYVAHSVRVSGLIAEHQDYLKSHTPEGRHVLLYQAIHILRKSRLIFLWIINMRERVCCSETYFNNRM